MRDEDTGECHIADVRTGAGLVIEFQRSSIDPSELQARENFYKKMVWIVDGCKNYADRFNFSNARSKLNTEKIVNFASYGRSKLFARWHTTTPVFIDFGEEHGFWRILRFDPNARRGYAGLVSIEGFVALLTSGYPDFGSVGGPASV